MVTYASAPITSLRRMSGRREGPGVMAHNGTRGTRGPGSAATATRTRGILGAAAPARIDRTARCFQLWKNNEILSHIADSDLPVQYHVS